MSYTYLQEQGEESSADTFSDIPACVRLRLNLTAERFCYNANATDTCPDSPSGMMYEPSTESPGANSLTLCAAGFLAKTLAQRERAQASPESEADSGERWPGSLAKYDPDTCSWRTAQYSLRGDLEEFSETWPRWGSMHDGECWERTMPVPHTSENASGFWPTPNTIGYRSDGELRMLAAAGLSTEEFRAMTHRAAESKRRAWYQTPTVQDAFSNGGPSQANRNTPPLNSVIGGALNPPWVEWLMGWPIGWTDLQPLAMDKFQAWRNSHGEP